MRSVTALFMIVALLVCLCGCMETPEITTPSTASHQVAMPTTAIHPSPPETVPTPVQQQEVQVLQQSEPTVQLLATVEAPGTLVEQGGGMVVDYSNAEKGYVMVRCQEAVQQKLKVQVKGPRTTYTYTLTPLEWTAFPLSDENGMYQIVIYQNVVDTKYAVVLSLSLEVTLEDPFGPFLRSNQYVNFDAAPKAIAKAAALTANMEDPLEKVTAVYDYVVENIRYDQELAASVKSGYLPVLDSVLESGCGICFDYASLMTGMLRSQGIPTKLVVGYAGQIYHAWISVWTENTGWVDGVIFFDGMTWKRMDPTFASSSDSSEEILLYIANENNYTAKYFY